MGAISLPSDRPHTKPVAATPLFSPTQASDGQIIRQTPSWIYGLAEGTGEEKW